MTPPTLSSTSVPAGLRFGLTLPWHALQLVRRTPRLLALSLTCAVVTAFALLGAAVLGWNLSAQGADLLVAQGDRWHTAANLGLRAVLFLALFAVGALTLPNLLLAPLQDPLSEATEVACGDFVSPPFSLRGLVHGTVLSLRHTLARLLLMTTGSVLLLPLNLLPGVGSFAYVVLSSTWAMFWLSVEHLSNPMARHLRPFREVLAVTRRHWPACLGLGAALLLMLWVPVVNFFLMPVAVVSGTLLYRALGQVNALSRATGNEDRP